MDVNDPGCEHGAVGALLCILSAAGFGAMAIFGKLAYEEGVEVGDLLLVRFALAAAVLLALAWARGALRGLPRRAVLVSLAMGAVGYATQSGLFFSALERMDASLLALILYTYPVMVCAAAVALGRERASARRIAALLAASAGAALVLAGAATGSFDALGAAMGFGAALAYTTYILVGDRVVAGVPPLALAALVCTGAASTFAAGRAGARRAGPGVRRGGLGLDRRDRPGQHRRRDPRVLRRPRARRPVRGGDPVGVRARRHGRRWPRRCSGSRSALVQLAGGALVLAAVVVMQWPGRRGPAAARCAGAGIGRGRSRTAGM